MRLSRLVLFKKYRSQHWKAQKPKIEKDGCALAVAIIIIIIIFQ